MSDDKYSPATLAKEGGWCPHMRANAVRIGRLGPTELTEKVSEAMPRHSDRQHVEGVLSVTEDAVT